MKTNFRNTTNNCIIADLEIHGFSSFKDLLSKIFDSDNKVSPGFAVAINPEKIVLSTQDPKIRNLLKTATLRFCDGVGVVKLLEKRTGQVFPRLPGCELWLEVMKAAALYKSPVYILGGTQEVNDKTREKLVNNHGVNVVGARDGFFQNDQLVIEEIIASGASIVTVAMGSPRQEEFIVKCMNVNPNCFYLGVGGTYDVFTGEQQRAPEVFRNNGLEWFYRLIKQPTRLKRHFRLVKFLYLAWAKKV